MTWKSASQIARENLTRRNEHAMLKNAKSPSQKHSEALRKKLNHRDGHNPSNDKYVDDCRDCPDRPCGKTLNGCSHPARKNRCKCGAKVQYRVIEGKEWDGLCPVCRERCRA